MSARKEAVQQHDNNDNAPAASADIPAQRVGGGRNGATPDAPPTNRASNKCNQAENQGELWEVSQSYFQPLRWGIDSLYLSFQGEIDPDVDRRLKELKALAQSLELNEQGKAQYPVGDHLFEVKDKGARRFPYVIEDGAFRIQLGRSKRLPWAYAKVSAGYLAAHRPQDAQEALIAILGKLGTISEQPVVARIDQYVDFASEVDMESWTRHCWITRASAVDAHAVDGGFTGWSIGKGGVISSRLYDKTREIEVSGKQYMRQLWQESGWGQVLPVWRLEFQYRRELLKQLGLVTLGDVMSNLSGLWGYATTEWLRLTVPSEDDKTRSRWSIHSLWAYLSSIDWETDGGPLLRTYSPKRLPDEDRLCQYWLAMLISFMASRGITERFQGIDAMQGAVEQYFMRKADFLGLPLDGYIRERVAAKAREFNTLLNDPNLIEELTASELERLANLYLKASKG